MSPLDEALSSLRDDVGGHSTRENETRRIVVGAARPPARKIRFLTLLAAAAVLVGSTAWAGYTGRLGAWFGERTSAHEQGDPPHALSSLTSKRRAPLPLPPVASASAMPEIVEFVSPELLRVPARLGVQVKVPDELVICWLKVRPLKLCALEVARVSAPVCAEPPPF